MTTTLKLSGPIHATVNKRETDATVYVRVQDREISVYLEIDEVREILLAMEALEQ